MTPKPRKSPLKPPDAPFEGLIRAIGRPILKKLKEMEPKKAPPRSKPTKRSTGNA